MVNNNILQANGMSIYQHTYKNYQLHILVDHNSKSVQVQIINPQNSGHCVLNKVDIDEQVDLNDQASAIAAIVSWSELDDKIFRAQKIFEDCPVEE
jgi:hypothetical protein